MDTVTLTHATSLSRIGYALADGTRTRILLALREGPAQPGALAEQLGVSKQVMSNQLACLRGCDLVKARAKGRSAWYELADPQIASTLGLLLKLAVAVDPACCTPGGCTCR
ncbi:ArsR/SmtB family transcription factor [Nesterenkonia lutea]|uniref:DNA-binding transcriptional ArsR family regulator n=1 Tax=Nesterenkonia lutea TaxID=272919 RepID=A0ABR9JBR2_9MICC|nr:metalloregulator ArsR/SmtB family transcription factor [Nesterenkonia lutea]MBE1523371.1 DNA-binding transcriptional ArsR family regulator [Nesterenkonia lutea]